MSGTNVYKSKGWVLGNAVRIESVKCACGCRIHFSDFNERGWTVCVNCKRKIVRPRDGFKKKLKEMLKEK